MVEFLNTCLIRECKVATNRLLKQNFPGGKPTDVIFRLCRVASTQYVFLLSQEVRLIPNIRSQEYAVVSKWAYSPRIFKYECGSYVSL